MTKSFDVIVVGGALNGLAAGLALGGHRARRPLSVAIVDRKDPRQNLSSDDDARASAITASSKRMFEALGVWEHIAQHMQEMRRNHCDRRPRPRSQAGAAAIWRSRLRTDVGPAWWRTTICCRAFLALLEKSPNITLVTGHAVAQQSFAPGLAKLTLANGEQFSCSLVIAADGGKSPLRAAAGIELVGWSYDQMGIVASFDHELSAWRPG